MMIQNTCGSVARFVKGAALASLPEPDYFWKARGEIQELICAWLGTQYTLYKASNILLLI